MSITPSKSEPKPSSETPTKISQEPSKNYFRRRDFDSTLFSQDMAPNFQALYRNSNLDSQPNSLAQERDREILDQEKEEEEILDSERKHPVREFPEQTDSEEIKTDLIVPKEDQYYLIDEEGDIIKEPSKENEDKFQPIQVDPKTNPPIKRDSPNTKL